MPACAWAGAPGVAGAAVTAVFVARRVSVPSPGESGVMSPWRRPMPWKRYASYEAQTAWRELGRVPLLGPQVRTARALQHFCTIIQNQV